MSGLRQGPVLKPEQLGDYEDEGRAEEASAEEHVNKRIADGGDGRENKEDVVHIKRIYGLSFAVVSDPRN